jgi:ferric-dicitrate binding protein FerR (iron transport regulator)
MTAQTIRARRLERHRREREQRRETIRGLLLVLLLAAAIALAGGNDATERERYIAATGQNIAAE